MAGTAPSEPVKKICAIVEERDKIILEKDIRIKYYKNALDKVLDEIKDLEKANKRIKDEDTSIEKQLQQLEIIKNSVKESQEVALQSLINHQTFEKMVATDLETKEKEKQRVKQEFQNIYSETKEKLNQNPLYKELEEKKVAFLKLDIARRQLEVKIKRKRRIITQRTEIQKKIFYNFFVEMAENYLIEQRLKELQALKIQELDAVKKLYALQEDVKLRQKLGTPRDKIKKMANITFGTQECPIEKSECKVEPPQKKDTKLFNEKLNNMFQEDEPKNVVMPPKIRILNQKIIMPAFVAPNIAVPDKRKIKTIDMSRKWQKLMRNSSISRELIKDRISSSQQSEKQLSQSSQQSQFSQRSQASQQFCDPLTVEPSLSNKHHDPPIDNNVVNKLIYHHKDSQKVSSQLREKVPLDQSQMIQSLNVGAEQMIHMQNSQVSTPAFYEQPMPSSGIMATRPIPLSDISSAKSSIPVSNCDMVPKKAVCEPSKSVRFNLELTNQQTDDKSMFGGQSMFSNAFSPFSNRAPMQSENLLQEQVTDANNSVFNMYLMDPAGGNSHTGLEFDAGGNESQMRSPEFSYELEGEGEQQPFKAPEMLPFGGGSGFLSFGGARNMFNPF